MKMQRPKSKPDYYLEVLEDEILLYHPSRTSIVYLNQTASLIWQLCNGQRTDQEIVELLVDTYPDAQEHIAQEVASTLQQFEQQGIIEFV